MVFRVEKCLPFAAGALALTLAGCAQNVGGPPAEVAATAAETPMEAEPMPPDEGGAEQAAGAVEVAAATDAGGADASSTDEATAASEPPVTEGPGEFGVGSTFAWDATVDGRTQREASTIVDRREFRGREVYVIEYAEPLIRPATQCDGADSFLIDVATDTWVGCLKDGSVLARHAPNDFRYSWPLYVGKSWRESTTWVDNIANTKGTFTIDWTVAAWEEVTVPAGTFMAYRVERGDWPITLWYAPELMLTVKATLGGGDSGYPAESSGLVAYDIR